MMCPSCHAEFEVVRDNCPDCGALLMRSVSGVIKTSSVMISAGPKKAFFRSVQEVPEPLRSRLIESTQSENSGTILIADRAGKDHITAVIARRENIKKRNAARQESASSAPVREPQRIFGYSWVIWAGILLFLIAVCLIAAVFAMQPGRG